MHLYCHKPLTVAGIHPSGTGQGLFHSATSLLPVYNEKRKSFASPLNPLWIQSTDNEHSACTQTCCPCSQQVPAEHPQQQQAHPTQTTPQQSTWRFQTSGKLTQTNFKSQQDQEKRWWGKGAQTVCFLLNHPHNYQNYSERRHITMQKTLTVFFPLISFLQQATLNLIFLQLTTWF